MATISSAVQRIGAQRPATVLTGFDPADTVCRQVATKVNGSELLMIRCNGSCYAALLGARTNEHEPDETERGISQTDEKAEQEQSATDLGRDPGQREQLSAHARVRDDSNKNREPRVEQSPLRGCEPSDLAAQPKTEVRLAEEDRGRADLDGSLDPSTSPISSHGRESSKHCRERSCEKKANSNRVASTPLPRSAAKHHRHPGETRDAYGDLCDEGNGFDEWLRSAVF